VLALAGINAVGAVLFALVYALAGTRLLSQGAFWVALVVLFVAVTAVWVRGERHRGPSRDLLSRAGRIVVGLALPVIAVPGLILMPLFFLHDQLPPEARVADIIGPVMFLLLTSLALMVLANVAGVAFMAGSAFLSRLMGRPSRPIG